MLGAEKPGGTAGTAVRLTPEPTSALPDRTGGMSWVWCPYQDGHWYRLYGPRLSTRPAPCGEHEGAVARARFAAVGEQVAREYVKEAGRDYADYAFGSLTIVPCMPTARGADVVAPNYSSLGLAAGGFQSADLECRHGSVPGEAPRSEGCRCHEGGWFAGPTHDGPVLLRECPVPASVVREHRRPVEPLGPPSREKASGPLVPRAAGRPGRVDYVPNAPLREAFVASGLSLAELARRLGWVRRQAGRELPNGSRVGRALGVHDRAEGNGSQSSVALETARQLADALGVPIPVASRS
jgi:hypothetical protein